LRKQGWNPPLHLSLSASGDASHLRELENYRGRLTKPPKSPASVALPAFDDPAKLDDWSIDVQLQLVTAEFLSRVSFDIDRVQLKAEARLAPLSGSPWLIASLTRPTGPDIDNGPKGLSSARSERATANAHIDAIVAQDAEVDSFILHCTGLRPLVHPSSFLFARAVVIVASLVCQRFKHAFAVPRPHALDSAIAPLLPVPGHGSFPGGHATLAAALATVLPAIWKRADVTKLMTLVDEIALNRLRAGLHYQLDSEAGKLLGAGIGIALLQAFSVSPTPLPLLTKLRDHAAYETKPE
ncbi:MAG: phosphatase PAP2 family protein, partial [Rubrivivax sp.]|nr:phosphatase PAP2 family protein [Rubrivivax sp.]